MKIRSDFVTNSSSSSFMISLNMNLADGFSLCMEAEQWSGDDDSFEYLLRAESADGDSEELAEVQAYGYEELDNVGKLNVLDLVKIADAPKVDAMISAITKSLCYEDDFAEDALDYTADPDCIDPEELDDLYDDFDEDISEIFPAGEIREFLEAHLTKKKDLKEITMEIELGGFGEGIPNAEEIISYLFGNSAGADVENALETCLEEELEDEEALETLREMKLFKRFTDDSLLALLHLMAEEYLGAVRVKIHLNTKGKISMEISEEISEFED